MFIVSYTSSSYTEGSDHPMISTDMFVFKTLDEAHLKVQHTFGEYMNKDSIVIRHIVMDTNGVGSLSFISKYDNGKKSFHEIHMYIRELTEDGNLTWNVSI